jgi:hypothetical protein
MIKKRHTVKIHSGRTAGITDKKNSPGAPFKQEYFIGFYRLAFLMLSVVFSLAAARQPFLYKALTYIYGALHLPLEVIYAQNGYEILFPAYFFINILLASISAFFLLYFCGGSYDDYSGSFIKPGTGRLKERPPFIFFILSILVYMIILKLHLTNKMHFFQLVLSAVFFCMVLYYAHEKDRLTHSGISVKDLLMKYELPVIFLFCAVFIIIYAFDLDSWKYSYIGDDELSFWDYSNIIRNLNSIPNPFSGKGVFQYHPVLSSLWQSLFMKFGGYNSFAWKLSSAVIPALAFVPLYLWTLLVFGRRAAVFTSISFVFSQGVMAFGHLGYNNVQSLLPFTLSLLFCELALRKNSLVFVCLCAFSAALGWNTFYSARLACAAVALYYVISPYRKNLSFSKLSFGIMLFISCILFIFMEPGAVSDMMNQTSAKIGSFPAGMPKIIALSMNFTHSLFTFMFLPHESHITVISLMDYVSCAGIVISIVWMFSSLKSDWRARLILSFFLLFIFVIGTISQYANPPITRIFFLSIIFSIMAGVGWSRASGIVSAGKNSAVLKTVFISLLAALCAITALYRFYAANPFQYWYLRQAYFIEFIQHYAKGGNFIVVDTASKQAASFRLPYEINRLCAGTELVTYADLEKNLVSGKYIGKTIAINGSDLTAKETLKKYSLDRHTIRDAWSGTMVYYLYSLKDENYYKVFSDIVLKGKTNAPAPADKSTDTESGYKLIPWKTIARL